MSWTPSRSQCGWSTGAPSSGGHTTEPTSGRPSALTRPWATSIRNPSTPSSNQKLIASTNSSWTSGWLQLRSGCPGVKRCRYHCPRRPSASVIRVHAGHRRTCSSSRSGAFTAPASAIAKDETGALAEPGPAATASLNQACWSEVIRCRVGRGSQGVGLGDHRLGVGGRAERPLDIAKVRNVVAPILHRRRVPRGDPQTSTPRSAKWPRRRSPAISPTPSPSPSAKLRM